MKQTVLLSVVATSLLLIGCGNEKASEASKVEATAHENKAAESATTPIEKATQAVKETATAAKEAVAQKADEAKAVATQAVDKTVEMVHEAEEKIEKRAKEAKETMAKKVEEAKEALSTPAVNLAACAGCHGKDFEKKAMGISKVVKDMSKADIETALKGYQAGTYGGNMKALMKGQVAAFDEAKIKAIAEQIGK
jgi:cytochrome c-type protein NapB